MGTVTLTHDVTNETIADPSLDGDIMDTRMQEVSPNTNDGTTPWITVGKTNVKFTNDIAICFFDMAQTIPKDAYINAAEWWIYLEGYAITVATTFKAWRIRRHDWVESGCTWNDYKPGTPWGAAGALSASMDYDAGVTDDITGIDAGDRGTNTGATDTTLEHIGAGWTPGEWVGYSVLCNSKNMIITSNTDEILTGIEWIPFSNPGSPYAYVIQATGFSWNPSILNIVRDAQNNQNGKVHFKVTRTDPITNTAWFQYSSKTVIAGDYRRPHLRVTYMLDDKTFQVFIS